MSWTKFFHRRRWDDERAREIESYLQMETDANVARGMTPDEARAAARRKLGNPTIIREQIYEMNTVRFVESAWNDLRYGLRLLQRNPSFALVAVLTLALGTGANAAIFQLVNALRLRPLPVDLPGELVSIGVDSHGAGRVGWRMNRRGILSEPLWRALATEQRAFSSVFAYGITAWNLQTDGNYRAAQGLYVTGDFFNGLGVHAERGRVLTAADDLQGCASPGAVISHAFWQSHYGATTDVVGRVVSLDGRHFPIVGVTPRSFFGVEVGHSFDVALPLCAEPMMRGEMAGTAHRDRAFLDPLGRLKPGWTIERAQAQLGAISAGIFASTVPESYDAVTAKSYAGFRFLARSAATGVSGLRTTYAPHLWVLLGATGLVLLLACANLANLMLARATVREREIAVRLAIGASRRRLIRQLISESLLIAVLGACGGLLLARWLSEALVAFLSTESNALFLDLAPDWRVLTFVGTVAAAACVIFGLSPALVVTAKNPGRAVQAGGRAHTDSREGLALRRGLVVVQIALSMVLVVGGLLFGRTLRKLTNVDPGFVTRGVISLEIDLRQANVEQAARPAKAEEILARVKEVPGVRAAAQSFIPPMSGAEWNGPIRIDGVEREGVAYFNQVTGDYFRVMQMPLIAGRTFDAHDRVGTLDVAVVSQAFGRRHFPGVSPLGRMFEVDTAPGEPRLQYHIIGLVPDTKYEELREEWKPIVFTAATQERQPMPELRLVVRSDLPMVSLAAPLTRAIVEVAPGATVAYKTVEGNVKESLATERLMASLSGFFGVLALIIASIGLYGVIAYTVTRRRAEIGIRLVLGAAPGQVVRMILRESGLLLATGIVLGTVLALGASRWAAALLFGLTARDPLSFVVAAGTLCAISLLAAWLPARQASRLQPTNALRD